MRIAVVGLTHPFRGGIAHYTTLLVRALAERHTTRLYALRKQYPRLLFPGRTQLDESQAPLRVPHEASLIPWRADTWLRTALRIRRFRPDGCVFQYWHPFFAPAFGTLARLLGRRCRCIWELHNVMPHEPSAATRMLASYGFGSADAFVVHAQRELARLHALGAHAPTRVVAHASYGELARGGPPRAEARRALGLEDDEAPLLLFFGYVRRYKGLDLLLRAMPAVHAATGARLLVRGEVYEDAEIYRKLIDDLDLAACVDFEDRFVANEEIPALMAACDAVVLPYRDGTASGVAQLAFGAGRIVVATDVGGIAEVVEDGVTGFVAPGAEAAALQEALMRMLAPEVDLAGMEAAALLADEQRFGWDRAVEAIEALVRG